MCPTLWNRVNLYSSDRIMFFHCSRVQSLCYTAVQCQSLEFPLQFYCCFKWSPITIIQDFFLTKFLRQRWWIPTILPVLNNGVDSVFNPILLAEVMPGNDLSLVKQTNMFSTTTGFVFRHVCLRNEKLLIVLVWVKQLFCQLKDNHPCSNYPIPG